MRIKSQEVAIGLPTSHAVGKDLPSQMHGARTSQCHNPCFLCASPGPLGLERISVRCGFIAVLVILRAVVPNASSGKVDVCKCMRLACANHQNNCLVRVEECSFQAPFCHAHMGV